MPGVDHDNPSAGMAISIIEEGKIRASSSFRTSLERLFRALTTDEICRWWVRPGVFDTRHWEGDLREGGRWTASGVGGGQPYALEGEFVVVDRPSRLVHTWKPAGAPMPPATVSYDLTPTGDGVRLLLRHEGIANPDVLERTRAGWLTSLERLRDILAEDAGAAR
jgi:uncharacterized protein YndB with AHSA1/START domain